jgi:hypothetical protein
LIALHTIQTSWEVLKTVAKSILYVENELSKWAFPVVKQEAKVVMNLTMHTS